jgi:hypothetical protein
MRRGRSPSPDDRPYKRERRSPPRRSPSGGRRSPMGRMERRSPPPETRRGGDMERRSPPPRDREEFERYCMTPGFRTLHHPETLVDQLVAQRAQALLAVPSVGRDIKTGLLLPPPLSGQPVSSATKLVKLDNLPDSVVAHAYPALLAAGAGGATAAPPDSSVNTAASARGRSLTAMIFGEPVRADNMRAKAWALYADEAGARTASAALLKLPQLSELVESVQASVEAFAPPVEPPPPQLSSESVKRHCERCDGIVTALEARLDMPGACQAALGKVGGGSSFPSYHPSALARACCSFPIYHPYEVGAACGSEAERGQHLQQLLVTH